MSQEILQIKDTDAREEESVEDIKEEDAMEEDGNMQEVSEVDLTCFWTRLQKVKKFVKEMWTC